MRKHCYVALTAVAVICAGPTPPPVGYLEKIGPAPLRFQAVPKPHEEFVLPPLAMSDPAPVEVFGPPAPTNAPVVAEVNVNVETETAVVEPVQSTAPVAPMVDPQSTTLTPQMLIQYFNDRRGTNGDYSVVVPYQFSPPPSIPAPPSRAVYTTK